MSETIVVTNDQQMPEWVKHNAACKHMWQTSLDWRYRVCSNPDRTWIAVLKNEAERIYNAWR